MRFDLLLPSNLFRPSPCSVNMLCIFSHVTMDGNGVHPLANTASIPQTRQGRVLLPSRSSKGQATHFSTRRNPSPIVRLDVREFGSLFVIAAR